MIVNSEVKNIVLLHGALGTKNDLLPLKNILASQYNVFSFNFSGHGDDTQQGKDFSIEQFTEDLSAFMSENNIKKTSLFGYSMGGYVALNYALTNVDKVEKMFTLGTKFDWNIEFATKQAKFLNAEKLQEKVPSFATYLEAKHGLNDWKTVVVKTANMMLRLGENPLLNENTLPQINIPVAITIGDADDMVTIAESEKVVNQLPQAKFLIINNTPHPIEKVNHVLIAENLLSFLAQ
jgi:pimeloyl-ACP methyl ester carboxylesterase